MKLVIEISDNHAPFVRRQVDLHGPEVHLDFAHFMALLPGQVVGVAVAEDCPGDQLIMAVEPLDGP